MPELTYDELLQQASTGDPQAQTQLGLILLQNSPREGAQWLRKAAVQGSSQALFHLSICYYHGKGVKKNMKKSVELLTQAAKLGNPSAEGSLGVLYYTGDGVDQDVEKGIYWITRGAEGGLAEAQCNLGIIFREQGKAAESIPWFRKSAALGFSRAQHFLAASYYTGDGVKANMKEAYKWWRKAAEQGLPDAQFNLGMCFMRGEGAEQSLPKAREWFHKAALQGHEQAIETLKFIGND